GPSSRDTPSGDSYATKMAAASSSTSTRPPLSTATCDLHVCNESPPLGEHRSFQRRTRSIFLFDPRPTGDPSDLWMPNSGVFVDFAEKVLRVNQMQHSPEQPGE